MTIHKRKVFFALVVIIVIFRITALADSGLFPKGDELFGVTMPDLRFVINREPDSAEMTEAGELLSYSDFSVSEYKLFGRYANAEGVKLGQQEYQNDTLTVELLKDGSSITFQYCYKDRKATLFYPKGVRRESKKSSEKLSDNLLPDASRIFGAVIPSFDEVLKGHPATKTNNNNCDSICYYEVAVSDYNRINSYLTDVGCKMLETRTEDRVLYADIILQNAPFTIQYDISNTKFVIDCPELYYVDSEMRSESAAVNTQLIMPSVDDAFGIVFPRISSAILRYPEKTEIQQDSSLYDEYSSFSEQDYSAVSKYLSDTGCAVSDYHVDDTGKLVILLNRKGSDFTFIYDKVNERGIVVYPPDSLVEPLPFISLDERTAEDDNFTNKSYNEETGNPAFIPEKLVEKYNNSVVPIFSALLGDDSYDLSETRDFCKVSFIQTVSGTSLYTNGNQTIIFIFGSTEQDKPAPNMSFYVSLKDNSKLLNLPEFVFAYAVSELDVQCSFEDFGGWVNDAKDGDTYKTKSFSAFYEMEDEDHVNILLINEN